MLKSSIAVLLLAGVCSQAAADDELKDLTGEWVGRAINDSGVKADIFVIIKENADRTVTGEWNVKGMTIEKGERVNASLLQWESMAGDGRYRVRCKQMGKSLVLEYTYTEKVDGKVKGGTGIAVLIKK